MTTTDQQFHLHILNRDDSLMFPAPKVAQGRTTSEAIVEMPVVQSVALAFPVIGVPTVVVTAVRNLADIDMDSQPLAEYQGCALF